MPVQPRTPQPLTRSAPIALFALLVVVACFASLWLAASRSWAGEHESKRNGTWWSSSSSGSKTIRDETYRMTATSTHQLISMHGGEYDGPAEVDAWTFWRENGRWRNSSGSERDWDEVQEILDRADGDLFWFRRGSERYLVTDKVVLRPLAELFAPQEELGRKQGGVGRPQAELGELQSELGAQEGALGERQERARRASGGAGSRAGTGLEADGPRAGEPDPRVDRPGAGAADRPLARSRRS